MGLKLIWEIKKGQRYVCSKHVALVRPANKNKTKQNSYSKKAIKKVSNFLAMLVNT
jgi:hypothetical protein